jgi:uncharacterized protein YbjT (DUF2867 family)
MILVTGATGNVGGELVRALAGAGQPVRALTRDDKPREFPPGVHQVSGDLNKPESMGAALSGATALFLYPGYQDMSGTLAEARQAGVRRVVMLSGSSAASAAMPADYVDAFFDFYVTGTLDESQPQPDVRDVTGREPRPFGQWAQAHAGAFRPS